MRIVQVYRKDELIPSERSVFFGNVRVNVIKMQGGILPQFYTEFEANNLLEVSIELVQYDENHLYNSELKELAREERDISLIKSQIKNNKIRFFLGTTETTTITGIHQWILTLTGGISYKTALFYNKPTGKSFNWIFLNGNNVNFQNGNNAVFIKTY